MFNDKRNTKYIDPELLSGFLLLYKKLSIIKHVDPCYFV